MIDASKWFIGVKPTNQLLDAIAEVETGGCINPSKAVSKAGAVGRYQIMPSVAKYWKIDPTNDEQARAIAGKELSQNYRILGCPRLAVLAYNRGVGNVEKDLKEASEPTFEAVIYHLMEIGNTEAAHYVFKVQRAVNESTKG